MLWNDWGLTLMLKSELTEKVDSVMTETRDALQTMFDALNQGQQKQIIKDDSVKELFDRYGVQYTD